MRWKTKRERQKAMAEQAFTRLRRGVEMGPCWHITLTMLERTEKGSRRFCNLDDGIRHTVWTPLFRLIRRRWPAVEAITAQEFAPTVGVHLHAVVRGTNGFDKQWLDAALMKVKIKGDPVLMDTLVQPIMDSIVLDEEQTDGDSAYGMAVYLTKQLRDHDLRDGWGAYFHPFSTTPNWMPKDQDEEEEEEEVERCSA